MKKLIYFVVLLGWLAEADAQVFYVTVYSGEVSFDNTGPLPLRQTVAIPSKTSGLKVSSGSNAIITTKDKKIVPVTADEDTTFEFYSLTSKLKNAGKTLIEFMSFFSEKRENESKEYGHTNAAVKLYEKKHSSERKNFDAAYPGDSAIVLSEKITLKWPSRAVVSGDNLVIYNVISNDTIYSKPSPSSAEISITLEKPGTYRWLVYSPASGKIKYESAIIKPMPADENMIRGRLAAFKKETEGFDESLRGLLLEEYYGLNNIVEEE